MNDTSFEDGSNSLDQYFVHSKMQYAIALKAQQKIIQNDFELRFLDVIKTEESNGWMALYPLLQLHYLSFQLLEQPDCVNFERYEQLLFNQLDQLKLSDQQLLFTNGLNYLIRQTQQQPEEYNLRIFQWYQKGLQHQITTKERWVCIKCWLGNSFKKSWRVWRMTCL